MTSYDNQGRLKIITSSALADLTDTTITAPATGEVAVYDGDVGKWVNRSAVPISKMYKNVNQTFVTATSTQLTWQVSDFDSLGANDLASDRFVVPYNGLYRLSGSIVCTGSWSGRLFMNLRVNGIYYEVQERTTLAGTNVSMLYHTILRFNAGALLTMNAYQASGINQVMFSGANGEGTWLALELLERT